MKRAAKARAIQLRQEGQSIKQIARGLSVSTSSVSAWVKGITLTEDQLNGLIQRVRQNGANVGQARAAGYRSLDEKERRAGYERAKQDADFRVLCGMYWGEGRKSSAKFSISNADARFIRTICSWLRSAGVEPMGVTFRVQYHRANGLTEKEVLDYWLAEVPYLRQCALGKCPCVDVTRPSQERLVGKCPCGTATIYVRQSRRLFNMVMGGIEFLSEISKGA
jgi:hypothetical protein